MSHRYPSPVFDVGDLSSLNPVSQFLDWLSVACEEKSLSSPRAMCLSTVSADGRPSSRMVLLVGVEDETFHFCSHYDGRKGKELSANPNASLVFYWDPLQRQVRIEGRVERLPADTSDQYFRARPRELQVTTAYLNQGEVTESRAALDQLFHQLNAELEAVASVPRPPHWGGFRLVPDVIEFWKGHANVLNDRLQFRKRRDEEVIDEKLTRPAHGNWVLERLTP